MQTKPQPAVRPCESSGFTELTDYTELKLPGVYWVDAHFDGVDWSPTRTPQMPHHHASRLELQNVADFPAADQHREQPYRFTVQILSRTIVQSAEREWRATYYARILSVCVPQ